MIYCTIIYLLFKYIRLRISQRKRKQFDMLRTKLVQHVVLFSFLFFYNSWIVFPARFKLKNPMADRTRILIIIITIKIGKVVAVKKPISKI